MTEEKEQEDTELWCGLKYTWCCDQDEEGHCQSGDWCDLQRKSKPVQEGL